MVQTFPGWVVIQTCPLLNSSETTLRIDDTVLSWTHRYIHTDLKTHSCPGTKFSASSGQCFDSSLSLSPSIPPPSLFFLMSHTCTHMSHTCTQVTVSSGGMLVMKLDPRDLQFENYTNFDGTFAYAQNKVSERIIDHRPYSALYMSHSHVTTPRP